MKQSKKQAKKLAARMKDYADMVNQSPSAYAGRSGPAKRVDSGGYHRPGSNRK